MRLATIIVPTIKIMTEFTTKINLYTDPSYLQCIANSKCFDESESGSYYQSTFCLKECGPLVQEHSVRTAFEHIEPYIENSIDEILNKRVRRQCVLLHGHEGKCESNPLRTILKKNNPTTAKIMSSIDLCIYNTPGADDYVFKNRANRLFPIPLSNENEKKIRDKKIKLKCAIPLREYSTPFMLASAFIDWITYTLNIRSMTDLVEKDIPVQYNNWMNHLHNDHKIFLTNHFQKYNRMVFDPETGQTICAVTRKELTIKNMADVERDNRVNIDDNDIQMGHIASRNDDCFTIKGTNLVMMTREGNRIIGEYSFIEDEWINALKRIVSYY